MSHYAQTPPDKDPQLWQLAQKRASFKSHLISYTLVNLFLWGIWWANGAHTYGSGLPWPVWPTFGWGIGLLFHYLGAYVNNGFGSVEKEYEKLSQDKK